jgi:signal recognition particle GTPase
MCFFADEPYDYIFHCTVWSEGLDKPVNNKLLVRIVDSYGHKEREEELLEERKRLEEIVGRDNRGRDPEK